MLPKKFYTHLEETIEENSNSFEFFKDLGDFKNVSKAFGFSKTKYVMKIMIPYALPHIITGLRLSIGVAWLVIVAGEMLSGGTGIGFFVWDSWNALSLEKVISAIIIIGVVGLILDRLFLSLGKLVTYK